MFRFCEVFKCNVSVARFFAIHFLFPSQFHLLLLYYNFFSFYLFLFLFQLFQFCKDFLLQRFFFFHPARIQVIRSEYLRSVRFVRRVVFRTVHPYHAFYFVQYFVNSGSVRGTPCLISQAIYVNPTRFRVDLVSPRYSRFLWGRKVTLFIRLDQPFAWSIGVSPMFVGNQYRTFVGVVRFCGVVDGILAMPFTSRLQRLSSSPSRLLIRVRMVMFARVVHFLLVFSFFVLDEAQGTCLQPYPDLFWRFFRFLPSASSASLLF